MSREFLGKCGLIQGRPLGSDIVGYASEFDRAAPDASWARTEEANVLIAALNRFAIGPSSTLTPETRLQEDRGMSAQDLTELFAILRQNGELDGRAIGLPRSTIAKLKTGKAQFPRGQSPGISDRLGAMQAVEEEIIAREGKVIEGYQEAIREHGSLRMAARALGIDPSNLSRRLRRRQGI